MILSIFLCVVLFFSDFVWAEVLIYNDEGVDQDSLIYAQDFFESRNCSVRIVDAEFLKEKAWISENNSENYNNYNNNVLVIPGGADCPYHRKLRGIGCDNIKEFVRNGGTYVGICAGGYFGCKRVKFAIGTELEVDESRELSFFPGVALGPMLKPYVYDSEEGASAAAVETVDGRMFYAYHNGGGTFVFDEIDNKDCKKDNRKDNNRDINRGIKILARYSDAKHSPAIIKCKYGKGVAILSGVHYEINPKMLLSVVKKEDMQFIKPIAEKINSTLEIKENFLDEIFKAVIIKR